MTTPELEALRARLTAAQREMVLTEDRGFAAHAKGHWHGRTRATGRKLYELGLVEMPDSLTRPTALGLALRAHIIGAENAG